MALDPSGKILAYGYDYIIKLWDVERKEEIKTLKSNIGMIESITFNSDGTMLASGDNLSYIKLWNVEKKNGNLNYTIRLRVYIIFEIQSW